MLATLVLAALLWQGGATSRCDRQPEGATSQRHDAVVPFGLRVASLPPSDQPGAQPRPASSYLPGQDYIVSLVGEQERLVRHFTDFMVTVESLEGLETGSFAPSGNTFTKFSERCRNAVVQTSSMPKLEVSTFWRAPPPGSGCVVFRASVVVMRDLWYMDDGPLSLQLCEEAAEAAMQPVVVDPCCACNEAKYEMAFEGLWSRHTHPKDFPKDHFKAKFSDVIGASHMVDYRFWNYGEFASGGLKELAEEGSTRTLESELKEKSQHIRTIIKARGIGYPNVTGKTFAVFRVDSRNHLMSIVSKLAPSPDWIVGVSGLELCLPDCSWIDKQVIELYPWDTGTDGGVSYESDDSPSIPAEQISKITSNFPNDPESPFYDPDGEDLKPLAKLYVTRQRLYEKETCVKPGRNDNCAVTQWSQWTACSASCGEGRRSRQRFYADRVRAQASKCRVPLKSSSSCFSAPCRDRQKMDEAVTLRCVLSEWSDWSRCTATCGMGYHTRTRHYLQAHAHTGCAYQPGAPQLEKVETCEGVGPCDQEETGREEEEEVGREEEEVGREEEEVGREEEEVGREEEDEDHEGDYEDHEEDGEGDEEAGGERDGEVEGDTDRREEGYESGYEEENNVDNGEEYNGQEGLYANGDIEEDPQGPCPRMTEWTAWSACSATCGRGTRIRNRYHNAMDEDTEMIANLMREEDDPAEDVGVEGEDCDTRTVEEEDCQARLLSCEPPSEEAREICLMDMDKGPCYYTEVRWYYSKETQSCQQFEYGGCRGNRNKFNSREACEQMCGGVAVEEMTTEGGPFGGLVPGNQITNVNNLGLPLPTYTHVKNTRSHPSVTSLSGPVVDCVVSSWGRWSGCSTSCGPGYKHRTRTIKVSPRNGGKSCPEKLLRRKRCHIAVCVNQYLAHPIYRRHSEEVNPEDVYGSPMGRISHSAEEDREDLKKIQEHKSSNEIIKNSAESSNNIATQPFVKPPIFQLLHEGEIDCELSEWTAWSSCTMTCGTDAYMQRTRSILTQPSEAGLPCDKRIQVKPCMLRPCRP